jgi:hypothetical protein
MNTTSVVGAMLLVMAATEARAFPGTCLLKVDGRTYLSGQCNIDVIDRDGSFTIGTDQRRITYFAYVLFVKDGAGIGYWNEKRGGSHAHTPLGDLKRDGACWVNNRARVCAWR